jgi:hypothetical protein
MNLTSYGCSFIFGTDMQDAEMIPNTTGKPSQRTWPSLLAQHLDLDYQCRAYPGCGNLLIAERILLDLDKLSRNTELVVIGWTWIDRFDYNNPDNKDNWNTVRPSEEDARAKFYFRDLHSEYRDKLSSLIVIKMIIDTLKQKNIPFLMTYMDPLLFDQQWHVSKSITYLQDYVRPYMTLFEGLTFLEWCRSKNFALSSTWHPLDQAHATAGDYIIRTFDKQNTNDQVQQARV